MKYFVFTAPSHPKVLSAGCFALGILISFFMLTQAAHAGNVVLAWDPPANTQAAGYRIHYGTGSGDYRQTLNVGNTLSCSISGLEEQKTYYFAATAYDGSGLESDYSNEVEHRVPASDTDGDGVSDTDELEIYGTDPDNADTDGDGVSDGDEIHVNGTDPTRVDVVGDPNGDWVAEPIYRINAGGTAITADGLTWDADCFYGGASNTYVKAKSIASTAPEALYQSERFGRRFSYSLPATPGVYSVRLHFAEIYFSSAGKRIFDVDVENAQARLVQLDIFSAVGADRACVKSINDIHVSDGSLDIAFEALADNAKIAAIEVFKMVPVVTDTDGDGLTDSDETHIYGTNPGNPDTDGDGVSDGDEVHLYGTDPRTDESAGEDQSPAGEVLYRINAGGTAVTTDGLVWEADRFFNGATKVYRNTTAIGATQADAVYQSERYGSRFSYNFPVAAGTYTVRLHFAEIYFSSAGKRIFDVSVEDAQAGSFQMDIVSAAGPDCALVRTIADVNVTDGSLDIDFAALADNAKISAIEILSSENAADIPVNTVVHRINTGGKAVTLDGADWEADRYYSGSTGTYARTQTIAGTTADGLYQSERYGKRFSYIIPVDPGTYTVNLHFAEIYFSSVGKRVFNIDLEDGQGRIDGLDIVSAAGPNAAFVKTIENIQVVDGSLDIDFEALVDNGKVSAIEVIMTGFDGTARL